jgi:hypothetical protein
VGSARANFDLESNQMAFEDLIINVKNGGEAAGWELTGVNVQVNSYSDSATRFTTEALNV